MAEYIELEKLLGLIKERNIGTCNGKLSCLQVKRMVESIPAADVAEVVRCRECKSAYRVDSPGEKYGCDKMSYFVSWRDGDDFCSRGEAK